MEQYLYEQAKKKILDLITTGKFQPNLRIWNERLLSQRLGYSRSTIKHAINSLVSDNILEKRTGDGTYLVDAEINNLLEIGENSPNSFSQVTRINKKTSSSHVESFKVVYYDPTQRHLFGDIEEFYELIRTRMANGKVVALQRSYIPFRKFSDAHRYDFSKLSLYDYMDNKNQKPVNFNTSIKAVERSSISLQMNLIKEKYLLYFEYLGYTKDNELVEFTKSWYDPNTIEFAMNIKY
ncbi:GntR family transcriptional regulator [Lactobacillus sp. ESL0679]|uniref:GntR family transcriptional regulator n=1 Tax=Lactobacillus sp. ESL0679 TaxID=2983209 RepID=UPI0023F9C2B4|nr:GntR family transcriptional regulator [Lactobacillus sp. ESL0679]MDF7682785.1 GntR family transcriptional regulator [Lactobacillus sp. ESL0679]